MFLVDILFFIIDNFTLILIGIGLIIIIYSWITIFVNKDYKFIADYSRKYKNRALTIKDLDKIKHEIEYMEDEIIKLLKEISSKLDDIKSECTNINLNTYDID